MPDFITKQTKDGLGVSVIRDIEGMKSLKDEWDALLNQIPERIIFQTHQWNIDVVRPFQRHNQNYFCHQRL